MKTFTLTDNTELIDPIILGAAVGFVSFIHKKHPGMTEDAVARQYLDERAYKLWLIRDNEPQLT